LMEVGQGERAVARHGLSVSRQATLRHVHLRCVAIAGARNWC
jgi:hypothetical protein